MESNGGDITETHTPEVLEEENSSITSENIDENAEVYFLFNP